MSSLLLRVGLASDLAIGEAKTFAFKRGRQVLQGFVLRNRSGLVAFLNQCPHWHVDLDLGDGDFWDPQGQRILCRNHGAWFDPESGVCVSGPCPGASLERFELRQTDEGVSVMIPDAEPA